MSVEPREGDTRNKGNVTRFGKAETLVNATTGETVFYGPMSSVTHCTGERYCAKHGWQPYEGIFQIIIGCPICAAQEVQP